METEHCRICFTDRDDLTEICDEIRETFFSLTNIHLINSEAHSSYICRECKDKLESTRDYVKLLAENEMQLRNKFSIDNSLLIEDHQTSSYYPQIKTENVEHKVVRNQGSNIPNHKIKAQKRTYQEMSENVGTRSSRNFVESVYLNEYGNEDSIDDVALSPENEGINDQEESLSMEMIDNINDLEDAKNVFRLMFNEIRDLQPQELKNSKVAVHKPTPQISSVDGSNIEIMKITNMHEFEGFIKKINKDSAYRQELINRWKNLTNNTRQTQVNAKAYNILNELFERDFLVSSVRWGQPFEKDKIRSDQLYLKLQDEFNDIILNVYELERSKDSLEHIGKIFKNVFNNKVRREERKLQ